MIKTTNGAPTQMPRSLQKLISRWRHISDRFQLSLNFGKNLKKIENKMAKIEMLDSGCGSVGIVVASDSRGPRFESSHRQNLY